MGRLLAALVLLVVSGTAAANQYQQQQSSTWYADFTTAAAALSAAQPSGCTAQAGAETTVNGTSPNEKIHYTNFDRNCGGASYVNLGGFVAYHYCAANSDSYAWDDTSHACTQQQFVCPAAGTPYSASQVHFPNIHTDTNVRVAAPSGAGVCYISAHGTCADLEGGLQVGIVCADWQYTGAGEIAATATAASAGTWSGTAQTGRGSTVSFSSDVGRCVVFNGEAVCPANSPPSGTCITSAGGNGYCTRDAGNAPSAPPAPDDGTPGSAAVPDVTVSAGSGSTINVDAYSPGVLLGSTNLQPPTGSPAPSPSGGGTTGGAECGAANNPCHTETAGPSTLPPLGQAPEFGESLDTFVQSIQTSPLAQLALGLSASVPEGGAPPSASMTLQSLGGAQLVVEAPAPVVEKVEQTFPILARLGWILTAIFIFLSA